MKSRIPAVLAIATAVFTFDASNVHSQEMVARKAEGAVLVLPDTRLAVVQPGASGLEVVALVGDAAGAARTDIRQGDVVLALNGNRIRSHEALTTSLNTIATGTPVTLRLSRAGTELTISYAKPAEPPREGKRMLVTTDNGNAGAGVWTTSAAPSEAKEVVIAGIHIAENTEGMPEVQFKGSHPDASKVALKTGDVITRVNGQQLASLAGLELLLGRVASGADVTLAVTRAGESTTVTFRKPAP